VGAAVKDPRLTVLSFTGSDKVGWLLQSQAIRKKVLLELGGNAAVIVHEDADLARAADRCAFGGFSYAGQVCISVQRIFVQHNIYERFCKLLTEASDKLKCGHPADKDVVVGPMIDKAAADRVQAWVQEALQDGARLVRKGERKENLIAPTILTGVKPHHKLWTEEVFGPVVIVESYKEFSEALAKVNDSRFGLQAGVFTQNQKLITQAFEALEVGGVVANDIPGVRFDHMPYGGVKDSGLGREGLRYAMEDYCERRILLEWNG
jgi:glyceraldehyde-3-phosphate dehydrogenase (NADP+)